MANGWKARRLRVWLGTLGAIVFVGLAWGIGAAQARQDGAGKNAAGKDEAGEAASGIRPEAIRGEMRFLADDLLEGRGTGTRGHEIAAKFMAAEFEAMGLAPGGENGTYFQNVPLRSIRPDEAKTTLSIVRNGKEESLVFRQDFISLGDAGRTATSVEAPVVYVGFGVTAPELNYDDYAGTDVKGKIVAYVYGAPSRFESSMRAHYSSGITKAENAAKHGAVGLLLLDSPVLERVYSFKEHVSDLAFPALRWMDGQGKPNDFFPGLRGSAALSIAATAKLFEGSGKSAEQIYAAVQEGHPSSLPLPVTAKLKIVSIHEEIHSVNVVARLAGSDPQLQSEFVVYTAHLDHLGIGEPVNGDKIYNGAMDNASGSACLLEIARAFAGMKVRPRRSILFVSVTGEEEGLLGSDYFAHFPTVAKDALVADINMDGAALLWPVENVTVHGADHSTLGIDVQAAATQSNLEVSPDLRPELVFFVRSDQYSFVKQGIPAVFANSGLHSSDPKIKPEEIIAKWRATIYHKPQDDMSQPFNFESAAKFARFNFLIGYFVAEKDDRPTWNTGDFFGEKYGKKKD
jgi:hypothetical protein